VVCIKVAEVGSNPTILLKSRASILGKELDRNEITGNWFV